MRLRTNQLPAVRSCNAIATAVLAFGLNPCATLPANADENGVSFWVPGLEGSFAAVPGVPGWSFAAIYYHPSVSSGADVQTPRGGNVDIGLSGEGNLVFLGPTYTFETPVLGAQAAVSLLAAGGRNQASVDATLSGPAGNEISGSRSERLDGFADLVPQVSFKWNAGVHNYLAYATGDIPVGAYDPVRLANLGLGHAAIDAGGGYTYFNPKTGIEFSAVAGLTYNFKNPDTDYQSGVDAHIDVAASKFVTEKVFAGAAAYYLDQITDDSGANAVLGGYQSRVAGIGPQLGYKFDAGTETAGLLSVKGYYEFAAENRPQGWNVWLTLAFSPKPH